MRSHHSLHVPLLAMILPLLLLLQAPCAAAREYAQLYDYRSLITSRADAVLAQSMREGLEEVLRRLTPGDLRNPLVLDALDRAPQFVTQSRFEALAPESAAGQDNGVTATRLVLRYSANLIQNLLRDAGLPMWGSTRPFLLVMLQLPSDEGDLVLADASNHSAALEMRNQAERVGLPLQFPLMDIDDQLNLSPQRMRVLDLQALQAAARRYGSDHWLAGVLTRTENGWAANWRASLQAETWTWKNSGAGLDELLAPAVDAVAVPLLARYSVQLAAEQKASLLLTVTAIDSLRAHVTTLRALGKITGVRSIELDRLRGETAVFRIFLEGEARQFVDQLSINDRFQQSMQPVEDSSNMLRLHYRYLH